MQAIGTTQAPPKGFGARAKLARIHAGLTISDVARELRASRTAVKQWEQSDDPTGIGVGKAIELAALLGVAVGWLLVGETGVELIAVSQSLSHSVQKKAAESLASKPRIGRKIAR